MYSFKMARCVLFVGLVYHGMFPCPKNASPKRFLNGLSNPLQKNKCRNLTVTAFIGALQGIRTPDLLVRRDTQIVELHYIWWNLAELSDKSSVQETKRPISASVDMLGFMQKLIFCPFVRILLEQTTPSFWRRISFRIYLLRKARRKGGTS